MDRFTHLPPIPGTHRKVPFLLGNCVAGFRGKVDGNEQQRLFSRYGYMKGILRNPLGCVFFAWTLGYVSRPSQICRLSSVDIPQKARVKNAMISKLNDGSLDQVPEIG